MEDVLEVYARPLDEARPVVCLDEKKKELRSTPRGEQTMEPGRARRVDSDYARGGAANVFLWVEPLTGRVGARVTERRTSLDFAEELRALVEEDFAQAEKIVLVTDNLNTHDPACLYEAFSPERARAIASRLEWHYTPVHGSWLNVAEIELSVLGRQALSDRIKDIGALTTRVGAWTTGRNADPSPVNWQFTTADARVKLRRLYPKRITNDQPN